MLLHTLFKSLRSSVFVCSMIYYFTPYSSRWGYMMSHSIQDSMICFFPIFKSLRIYCFTLCSSRWSLRIYCFTPYSSRWSLRIYCFTLYSGRWGHQWSSVSVCSMVYYFTLDSSRRGHIISHSILSTVLRYIISYSIQVSEDILFHTLLKSLRSSVSVCSMIHYFPLYSSRWGHRPPGFLEALLEWGGVSRKNLVSSTSTSMYWPTARAEIKKTKTKTKTSQ